MIPYLEPITVGPVNSFGILVALGVFFGCTVAYRHSERLDLDQRRVRQLALACGLCGLWGAHLVDVLLYQPGWMDEPGAVWTLLNPFAGISSMGGVLGATLGFVVFAHRTGIHRLKFADTAALGLLVLLAFGRAGCASVHDHVGVATSSPLAVDFPPGNPAGVVGPHHDLGLYELVLLLVLLSAAVAFVRRPRRPGLLVGLLAIAYAVPRFFLDFLRRPDTDPRILSLTPAQWATVFLAVAGVAVLWRVIRRPTPPPARYRTPTPWREYARQLLPLRRRRPAT